jgi:hypothetical protein
MYLLLAENKTDDEENSPSVQGAIKPHRNEAGVKGR